MSYSAGTLSAYTEQNKLPLVTQAVFNAKTQATIPNKRVGIKFQEAINLFNTDAVFQAGTACGFTNSGTTSFTQRNIHVGAVKVQETLCPRTLENTWLATQLQQGSNYEGVPFEQQFMEQKAKRIAEAVEVALWQGIGASAISGQWTTGATADASGQSNLIRTSGLLLYAESTGAGITELTIGGALNSTNIVSGFEVAYQNTPVAILNRDDVTAYCGWDTFRILVCELIRQTGYTNLHSSQGDLAGNNGLTGVGELYYPGTNMKIIAVNGLNFTQRIFVCSRQDLFLGSDLLSDEDTFRMWADYNADDVKFQAALKFGINYAFPSQICVVLGNNAVRPKVR